MERMPRRGEIWWAELDPVIGREQAGRRPVVIVSSNDFLETGAGRAAIVPITTKYRDLPSWVPINPTMGLTKPSWALPDQVRTIDYTRLVKLGGSVDAATRDAIDEILRLVLDL
jgi:mRNA interferase MazF